MAGHSKTKKNYTEAERRMFQERARKAVESRKQRAQAALQGMICLTRIIHFSSDTIVVARQAPSSTTTKGSRRSSRVVQANSKLFLYYILHVIQALFFLDSSTSAHKHAVSEIEESGPQKRPRSGIKLPATKAARSTDILFYFGI